MTPRCPPGIPGGQRVAGGESQLWRQVALKFWPLVSRETVSFRLLLDAMMILAGWRLPILEPFTLALVMCTVPKSASGSTAPRPEEGASTITSADERRADLSDLCSV